MSLRERCMEQWEQSETLWTFIMTFLSTDISISPAKMPDDPFSKSKILGGTNAWPVPHLKLWGNRPPPSPPRSPPLLLNHPTSELSDVLKIPRSLQSLPALLIELQLFSLTPSAARSVIFLCSSRSNSIYPAQFLGLFPPSCSI